MTRCTVTQHVFLLLLLLLELWCLLNANVFLETSLEGTIPRVDNGALLPNLETLKGDDLQAVKKELTQTKQKVDSLLESLKRN